MKARLVAFKGRRRDVANNYGIVEVAGENPPSLIGRKVAWKSDGGKIISGVIVRSHGRDSLLVRFRKGLPGNALGDLLELKEKPKKKKAAKAAKKKAAPKAVKKKAAPKAAKKKAAPKEKKEAKKKKAPAKGKKASTTGKTRSAKGKATTKAKSKSKTKAKTKTGKKSKAEKK